MQMQRYGESSGFGGGGPPSCRTCANLFCSNETRGSNLFCDYCNHKNQELQNNLTKIASKLYRYAHRL